MDSVVATGVTAVAMGAMAMVVMATVAIVAMAAMAAMAATVEVMVTDIPTMAKCAGKFAVQKFEKSCIYQLSRFPLLSIQSVTNNCKSSFSNLYFQPSPKLCSCQLSSCLEMWFFCILSMNYQFFSVIKTLKYVLSRIINKSESKQR